MTTPLPEQTYELRIYFDSSQPLAATVLKERVKEALIGMGRSDFVDAFADGSTISVEEAENLLSLGGEDVIDYMPMTLYDFESAPLTAVVKALTDQFGPRFLKTEVRRLDTAAWSQAWETEFVPWQTDRFHIVPADYVQESPAGLKRLVIARGEVFGTGQHATTRACLMGLEKLASSYKGTRKRLLDIGTGTGILAMAARQLGFDPVVGTDLDQSILDVASKNAEASEVSGVTWQTVEQPLTDSFDIVICNILLPELFHVFPLIQKVLCDNGYMLLSGFVDSDRLWVVEEATRLGFVLDDRIDVNGWDCLRFHKAINGIS